MAVIPIFDDSIKENFNNSFTYQLSPVFKVVFAYTVKSDKSLDIDFFPIVTTSSYCSPIKKIDIDFIRGVNTQFILKRLLLRGLIQKIDTKNSTFSVTLDFLSNMGIDSIEKLPNYEQIRFKMQESLEEIKNIINNDD